MPRKSRYGKPWSKRRLWTKKAKKRYTRRNKRLSVPYYKLNNAVLPVKWACKLKYADAFAINPGLAAAGVYSFRANDLFDPNYTSIGHQPHGFDQLMNLYNHFTVIGAKIRFRVSVPSNNDVPFIMAIHLDDDIAVTEAANITALMEQSRTRRKIISKPSNATGNELQITHSFSAKKFFSLKAITGEADYNGDASAGPAEQAYFHCMIMPMDATTDLSSYSCFVEIEYLAVFTEPKDLLQS